MGHEQTFTVGLGASDRNGGIYVAPAFGRVPNGRSVCPLLMAQGNFLRHGSAEELGIVGLSGRCQDLDE